MKASVKNRPVRPSSQADLCGFFLIILLLCVPLSNIQPASAAGQDPATLSLQVAPPSVSAGETVKINADVTANRLIKVAMLIYRLTTPGGEVHYLEPIILRDFGPGSSHHIESDYPVGGNSSLGNWDVTAYLCIGQCAIKGEAPPRNAAVTATGGFTIVNEPAPPPPPPPGPGPLSFPQ